MKKFGFISTCFFIFEKNVKKKLLKPMVNFEFDLILIEFKL